MAETVLEGRRIDFSYEPGKPILRDVNLNLTRGESMAIQGPSGVGKTTLLEILGLMRSPVSGEVLIEGRSVYDRSVAERSRMRGQYLGFVFQEGLLLPDLTLWENCRLAVELSPAGWSVDRTRNRFETLMRKLNLDPDRGSDRSAQLSTGERQRLAVVRSMMHVPRVLIADEPTGNLDPESSHRLVDLLLPLAEEQGMALLVATHDRSLAGELRQVYRLEDARLVHGS